MGYCACTGVCVCLCADEKQKWDPARLGVGGGAEGDEGAARLKIDEARRRFDGWRGETVFLASLRPPRGGSTACAHLQNLSSETQILPPAQRSPRLDGGTRGARLSGLAGNWIWTRASV